MMMLYSLRALLVTALLASAASAFSVPTSTVATSTSRQASPSEDNTEACSRRSLLVEGAAALLAAAVMTTALPQPALAAAPKGNSALGAGTVVGREIDTFNSLIYNFKNIDLGGGLDASTLKGEPSVPFVEFGEKMKAGEVTFVEFMAPSGDVAYATFKGKKEKIRIGEGYPITKKGSWSSPDYVIRSVSNFGVPYKFTVPALAKFSNKN